MALVAHQAVTLPANGHRIHVARRGSRVTLPGRHTTSDGAWWIVAKAALARLRLQAQRQCQYSRNAWNLRKFEEGVLKVSRRVGRNRQNDADCTCASDHQLLSVR